MSDMSFEHATEARAALSAIVTDPQHGVAVLSSAQTMSNLLKDLLPDAPREKSILVAAAEAGLASTLRDHVTQGMDPGTAVRLAASSFAQSTPYPPQACTWVAEELAIALGVSQPGPAATLGGAASGALGGGQATALPGQPGASSWPGPAGVQGSPAPAEPGTPPAPGVGAGQGFGQASGPGFGQASGAGLGQASGPGFGQASGPGFGQASGAGLGQVGWQSSDQGGWQPPTYALGGTGPQGSQGQALGGFGQTPGQVPGQVYSAPGQPYMPVQPGLPVRKTNNFAVVSLSCGIAQFIGWIIFLLPGLIAAILAIGFGVASMKQIRRRGEAGRGMAVIGLVLGILGVLGGIILTVLVIIGLSRSST